MNAMRLTASERALVDALRGLRFGSVEATVHDGRLVRLERREKLRLADDPEAGVASAGTESDHRERPDRRSTWETFSRGET